jgi:hypothetical protein
MPPQSTEAKSIRRRPSIRSAALLWRKGCAKPLRCGVQRLAIRRRMRGCFRRKSWSRRSRKTVVLSVTPSMFTTLRTSDER